MQKEWHVNFHYFNLNRNELEIKKVYDSLKIFCSHFQINESNIDYRRIPTEENNEHLEDICETENIFIRMNFIHKADSNFKENAKNFLLEKLWEEKFINFSFDIYESQFSAKEFNFNSFIEFKKESFFY